LAQIDKKIGKKIKQMRKALGLSQIDLAERIGLSFQQIQKYEKGASKISVFRLEQISKALGVNIKIFFEGEESGFKVSGPTVGYSSGDKSLPTFYPEESMILKLFRKVKNKKLREGIFRQLKGIIELEKNR